MGGEGSMMRMIHTLRNNKSMLTKRKERKALQGSYANIKLEFPKATPEVIIRIREKVIRQQKQTKKRQFIALGIVLTFLIILFINI